MFDLPRLGRLSTNAKNGASVRPLKSLVDRPQDEVISRVAELESQHSPRRGYPWQKLGLSPLATTLEPLAQLASFMQDARPALRPRRLMPSFMRATAGGGCRRPRRHGGMRDSGAAQSSAGNRASRLLPWLENTARHLQKLIRDNGQSVSKRAKPIAAAPGRLVLFADGLRMDVARRLGGKLATAGLNRRQDWEWSTIPSVTATAKPAASPIADKVQGGDTGEEFSTRLISTGQLLTQDRFIGALKERGWQFLGADQIGDPPGLPGRKPAR
jgi:hypothetical protein